MARPQIDYEKAARILVSAIELGSEAKAAAFWNVAPRTVRNYKAKLESDPELAAAFRKASGFVQARLETERLQLELGWRRECHATLREMLSTERAVAARIRKLVAKTEDIELLAKVADRLARSTERIGQLDVATEALGVGAADRGEGTTPAADAGGDPAEGDEGGPGPGADG